MIVCIILYEWFTHGLLAFTIACFDLILGGGKLKQGYIGRGEIPVLPPLCNPVHTQSYMYVHVLTITTSVLTITASLTGYDEPGQQVWSDANSGLHST